MNTSNNNDRKIENGRWKIRLNTVVHNQCINMMSTFQERSSRNKFKTHRNGVFSLMDNNALKTYIHHLLQPLLITQCTFIAVYRFVVACFSVFRLDSSHFVSSIIHISCCCYCCFRFFLFSSHFFAMADFLFCSRCYFFFSC